MFVTDFLGSEFLTGDLERIGIPYKTDEGGADFHAAGRHSYVTGLLLNGVGLVHAKELARHSDVKMGLDEQARSLNSLPAPKIEPDSGTRVSEWDAGDGRQQMSQRGNLKNT